MYVLYLPDIRIQAAFKLEEGAYSADTTTVQPVLRAESRDLLVKAVEELKVQPYKQRVKGSGRPNPYTKFFRKDSPLEWCAPPPDNFAEMDTDDPQNPIRWAGTADDWMKDAEKKYEEQILSIPPIRSAND